MVNDEKYLKNRLKQEGPFTVPDGYFEGLTASVMSRLPEREDEAPRPQRVATVKRMRPWLYAAACLGVGVVMTAALMATHHEGTQQPSATAAAETGYYSDTYIEDEANYAMIDNQEIYSCLLAEM